MCDSPAMLGSQSERIVLRHCDSDVDPGELSPRSSSVRIPAKPSSPTQKVYTPTAKARSLKSQFVEVYLGSAEFKASKLNAIIVINLQASDRLYEVVVVNEASEEEIGRVYVYENELKLQMEARHKATAGNSSTEGGNSMSAMFAAQLAAAEFGSSASLASRARRISATSKQRRSSSDFSTRKSSSPHLVPAHDKGDAPSTLPALVMARAAAQKFMDIKCNKNDQIKDEQLQKIMDYNNNPMKDSPLLNAPRPIDEPQSYFDLDMSTNIDPEMEGFKKYEKEAMERDQSLISADISSATADSIRFYTAVILSSLSVRRKAMIENSGGKRPFQFVLYDGCSKVIFVYFLNLPLKCLGCTVPSMINAKCLKTRVDYNKALKSDLDVENNIHRFVKSALGHEGQAKSELLSIGIEKHGLTDNLNPNRKRYRYMWQAAYNAVIGKHKNQKSIRSQWGSVIEKRREQAARETYLLEQSTKNKFRSLAIKTGGRKDNECDDTFSINDMTSYRNCLAAKKRRKSYMKCVIAANVAQKKNDFF